MTRITRDVRQALWIAPIVTTRANSASNSLWNSHHASLDPLGDHDGAAIAKPYEQRYSLWCVAYAISSALSGRCHSTGKAHC